MTNHNIVLINPTITSLSAPSLKAGYVRYPATTPSMRGAIIQPIKGTYETIKMAETPCKALKNTYLEPDVLRPIKASIDI